MSQWHFIDSDGVNDVTGDRQSTESVCYTVLMTKSSDGHATNSAFAQ